MKRKGDMCGAPLGPRIPAAPHAAAQQPAGKDKLLAQILPRRQALLAPMSAPLVFKLKMGGL